MTDGRSVDGDAVVLVEFETGNPSVSGDELVLLPDRFAQQVNLDVAGFLGDRMRADDVALAGVQGARSNAVVKLPDEPSPVPAGMSAILAISIRSSVPTSSMAARTIGCLMSLARSTRSSSEYLTI